jgi:hypothetical protein
MKVISKKADIISKDDLLNLQNLEEHVILANIKNCICQAVPKDGGYSFLIIGGNGYNNQVNDYYNFRNASSISNLNRLIHDTLFHNGDVYLFHRSDLKGIANFILNANI